MKSNLKETQLESNNSFSDYVKIFDYFGIPIQFRFKIIDSINHNSAELYF